MSHSDMFAPPAGLELADGLVAEVAAAYDGPGRHYHDGTHLGDVLARWRDVADGGPGWRQAHETWLALLFHDVVYVPGRHDNEAVSAQQARAAIARGDVRTPIDAGRVAALVELTARHGKLTPAELAGDLDAQLFLDVDMAIVGAAPAAFDAYDRGVAREYAAVPPELYREGRRAFLAGLLAKDRLFFSDFFHARLDAPARENLARALSRL